MDKTENYLNKIQQLSFEDALLELEKIIKNLETGKNSLDYLMQNFEFANILKNHCINKLDSAKLKLKTISDSELS